MNETITITEYKEVSEIDDWESLIKESHQEMVETSVPAMMAFAENMAAFKADCMKITKQGGTVFSERIRDWLSMEQEVGSKWALIGEKVIVKTITSLPPSMETLYRLSLLPPAKLEKAIEKGEIHPDMSQQDARALCTKGKKKRKPKPPTYADAEKKIEALVAWIRSNFNAKDQKSLARFFEGEMY